MNSLHLSEIARLVGGRIDPGGEGVVANGVSADTRTLAPGQLFFALRGGHCFVAEAFARGACAAVVEHDVQGPGPVIRVGSSIAALGALAGAYRLMIGAKVIAVTGSNGKTTTKDMIWHILSARRRVARSRASFNNDIGLPLTLLTASPDAEFLVLELGTNHPGDIARLAEWARPDAAVITSISEAHLEGLGSLEGIAAEKASLLRYVRSGGFAVVPAGEATLVPHLGAIPQEKIVTFGTPEGADLSLSHLGRTPGGIRFLVRGVEFRLPVTGTWNALNAVAASSVAMMYGVGLPECAERLADFRAPKMRMERLEIGGVTIINDAYNANPVSMKGALEEFDLLPCRGKKIAVIGQMGELGAGSDRLHEEVGRSLISRQTIDAAISVGPAARAMGMGFHYDCVEDARNLLTALVEPGDVLLLKGSRSVGLEKVIKFLAEKLTENVEHAPAVA